MAARLAVFARFF